jgi:hypothetical protein
MWTRLAKIFTWVGIVMVATGCVAVWFKPPVGVGLFLIGLITVARASTLVDHWTPRRWK